MGFTCGNPRAATERAHSFNQGLRDATEDEEMRNRQLIIRTFDIRDFFTNIPRGRFLLELERSVAEVKRKTGGARFF